MTRERHGTVRRIFLDLIRFWSRETATERSHTLVKVWLDFYDVRPLRNGHGDLLSFNYNGHKDLLRNDYILMTWDHHGTVIKICLDLNINFDDVRPPRNGPRDLLGCGEFSMTCDRHGTLTKICLGFVKFLMTYDRRGTVIEVCFGLITFCWRETPTERS